VGGLEAIRHPFSLARKYLRQTSWVVGPAPGRRAHGSNSGFVVRVTKRRNHQTAGPAAIVSIIMVHSIPIANGHPRSTRLSSGRVIVTPMDRPHFEQ
jgi:hypothetical protein